MEKRRRKSDSTYLEGNLLKRSKKQYAEQQQATEHEELSIELTNETGTRLQDVNDDCLRKIFTVKSLDFVDLCSLVEASKLFQQIIQDIAPNTVRIRRPVSGGCGIESKKYNQIVTRRDIQRIFVIFGSIFSDVSISQSEAFDEWAFFILNQVAWHCSDADDLKVLRLKSTGIPNGLSVELKPIFMRLEKLHLHQVEIKADASLFAGLNSLVELRSEGVTNCDAILENIFPMLERFTYKKNSIRYPQSVQSLATFIPRHKTLKTLDLSYDCVDKSGKAMLLEVICGNCKELEDLHADGGGGLHIISLQPLQTLKLLRTLTLRRITFEDNKFPSGMPELRELYLHDCSLPKDCNQFDNLTQLTKLEINNDWPRYDLDVPGIISLLVNLTEFKISDWLFRLDSQTFSKIAAIVKGRLHVLTLKCVLVNVVNVDMTFFDENGKIKVLPLQ